MVVDLHKKVLGSLNVVGKFDRTLTSILWPVREIAANNRWVMVNDDSSWG